MTKQNKDYLTPEQVAHELQLHEQTVLEYIRNGELKAMKLGRGYRVPRSSFEEFVSSRMTDIDKVGLLPRFSSRPKRSSDRYRSVLVVPVKHGGELVSSNPRNDEKIAEIVRKNVNTINPHPDIDGLMAEEVVGIKNIKIYFRFTEEGIVFLRTSIAEELEDQAIVHVRELLSLVFRTLKIAWQIYEEFKIKAPVFIKLRMVGLEGDLLTMGSFRRDFSSEDRALSDKIEIKIGPLELKKENISDVTVTIVQKVLRGFGNNRLQKEVLKDFLKNILAGTE